MQGILDLERYPLDRPDSEDYRALVAQAQADLAAQGLFNLAGLIRAEALTAILGEIAPVMAEGAYRHVQDHNIYFKSDIPGLAPDHPALAKRRTSNRKICADQIADSLLMQVYKWRPLIDFLARVMQKPALHAMADPLARVNVFRYEAGEVLNWHFDRSEFTTTLLLQAPESGGVFEYRTDLRSDSDPNYEGVARLMRGEDSAVRTLPLEAGTLNVFRGKMTAHRVSPVEGARARIIAVFSYYERPDVEFSAEDRVRFYGRAG